MISHRSEILSATWKMIRFKEYNFQNITSTFTYAFDVKLQWQFGLIQIRTKKKLQAHLIPLRGMGRAKMIVINRKQT